MSKLNNVANSIMSNPLVLVVIALFVLLIILAIIRAFLPSFSTGVGLNAHFGSIKGGVNLEAFENENNSANDPSLVVFKAEWCGHCKRAMPEIQKLMDKNLDNVKIIVIDSDNQPDLVKTHGVQGFPTIRMYPQGLNNKENYTDYEGERNVEGFTTFLERLLRN